MGRELIDQELTVENIDDAKFSGDVDPVDTLRRIAGEWLSIRKKCDCGQHDACSICEIDYLLCEAFTLPKDRPQEASPLPVVTNTSCPACNGSGRTDGANTWPPRCACQECGGSGHAWKPIKEPA